MQDKQLEFKEEGTRSTQQASESIEELFAKELGPISVEGRIVVERLNGELVFKGESLPKEFLLHVCCAPCAIFPIEHLRFNQHEPYLFFFNPNIHPKAEMEKRAEGVKTYAERYDLAYEIDRTCLEDMWRHFKTNKKKNHCQMCYAMRFYQAAKRCKELGYEGFASTLFISPYQNHEQMHRIGEIVAKKFDVKYYPFDWRYGFYASQARAKEENIYRQKYCGCIYSISESFYAKKIAKAHELNPDLLPQRVA